MKLAYIVNVRMPTEKAHGVQIMEMCSAFAERGANVTLLIPWRFNKIKAESFNYYGVKPNFKIVRIPCIDLLPVLRGQVGFLIQQLSFYTFAKVYVFMHNFDAIYGRDVVCPIFFKNSFYEVHNLPERFSKVFKWVLGRAKHLFALTSLMKEDLIKAGASAEKITVVPDGVNLDMFTDLPSKIHSRDELGLPTDKKIVLYTGSFYLYSWKGVDVLLEASKHFSADTLFVLVGGEEKEIEAIKNNGIGTNVLLIQHLPHKDIAKYLISADVLVLPNKARSSHSERYTSPLKLFEYMASGVPIVASHLPSICEVLNNENSFLIAPDNPKQLCSEITKILGAYEVAKRRAETALRDVHNYSWAGRATKILDILKR